MALWRSSDVAVSPSTSWISLYVTTRAVLTGYRRTTSSRYAVNTQVSPAYGDSDGDGMGMGMGWDGDGMVMRWGWDGDWLEMGMGMGVGMEW